MPAPVVSPGNLLDIDLCLTYGIMDGLSALAALIANENFLSARLAHDGFLSSCFQLDNRSTTGSKISCGCRTVDRAALHIDLLFTQVNIRVDRTLYNLRIDAYTTAINLALPDYELFFDDWDRYAFCCGRRGTSALTARTALDIASANLL